MGNEQQAHFVGILGTTGCGKSTELKKRLRKLPKKLLRRTFVWSPKEAKDNYAAFFPGSVVCTSVREVLAVLDKAGKSGAFHIVFKPTLHEKADTEMHSVCCKALLAVENVVMINEELHSVTKASYASHGWRLVNFMGRASGLYVFGLSQRPASVDKAFMGALSEIHVGQLSYPEDQKACAKILGVDAAEVAGLFGYAAIQRNMRTGKLTRIK